MKVAGLSGSELKKGSWYLFRAESAVIRNVGKDSEKMEVKFVVENGPLAGNPLSEDFLLKKAVSRLETFLSRSGYPKELIEQDELDTEKIPGLLIWAKVEENQYGTKFDGWNMRAVDDPPEGEKAIDYGAREAAEAATTTGVAADL